MEDFKWDWNSQSNRPVNVGASSATDSSGSMKDRSFIIDDAELEQDQNAMGEHAPLSEPSCQCKACMRKKARTPAEKQVSDEKQAIDRIAKLESVVKHLQQSTTIYPSSPDIPPPPPPIFPGRIKRMDSTSSLSSVGSVVSVDTVSRRETDAPKGTEGPKVEIKRCKKIHPEYGDPIIKKDRDVGAIESTPKNLRKESVLTVFREFDRAGNFWRRNVEILSPAFFDILRQVAPYDIDIPVVDDMLQLTEPLMLLFHHRKHLVKYLEDGNDDSGDTAITTARNHTRLVLDFLQKEWDGVNRTLTDLESAKPSGLITYPDLWLLYAPGTIVFTKENGEYEAFVVDSIRGIHKRQSRSGQHSYSKLELTCWSMNYDGEIFGRVWSSHWVAPFQGSKEINSLDLIPEKFLPNVTRVKDSLISRAKGFWALQGQNYREYTSEVWSEHMTEDSVRVMVDHLTFQRRNNWPITIDRKKGPSTAVSKNWKENKFRGRPAVHDGYDEWGRPYSPPPVHIQHDPYYEDDDLEDSPHRHNRREDFYSQSYWSHKCERPPIRVDSKYNKYDLLQPDQEPDYLALLLCPQRVHAYCLRDKIWKTLNVTQLKAVTFRKHAFERLVLDPEYKDIVQAMVSSYVDKTANMDDLIAGKGNGLVTLLHGPPGTGKTLTAECVAEAFSKPLYQVTTGDIGTDPMRLESRLDEIFDYATTWGAILLLDEADVFLQDRDYENLQRNALVSIFLRTLDYFSGILFLTTNRVGAFDQAFQSRIHITLGLPTLDRPRRACIWKIFLADLLAKGHLTSPQHTSLLKHVEDSWSKEELNGRQIRNAVRTALVVAERKGVVVGEREFERVLRIGREFEGYVGGLRAKGRGGRREGGEGLEGFEEVVG